MDKQNPKPRLFHARSIGSLANEILSASPTAKVRGITSRGIFLQTETNWIIYLSKEGFRGPLTVNLDRHTPALDVPSTGEVVQISPGQISIPDANLLISTKKASIWQPNPPGTTTRQTGESARLKTFVSNAYLQKKGSGLSGLLPTLLDIQMEHTHASQSAQEFTDDILSIQKSLMRANLPVISKKITTVLGRGGGLTPSGDDFLVGMILTLNRWKDILKVSEGLDVFNRQIIQTASGKTTTLSVNLIKCATMGLADERLINALDFLVSGIGDQEAVMNDLLDWGNSSGVDALVGMVTALHSNAQM